MLKKILKLVAIILVIAIALFFILAPGIVDRSKNTVIQKAPYTGKVSWYDSLNFIADLHCDALLWDRNLLKRHSSGQVDLPRLQEANVALQVFGIVSKTPKNQNYDHNDSTTDQITLLSFVQLQPPSSWFSLKARALHQCAELQKCADASNGQLRLIENQLDLQKLIEDRRQNKQLVGSMLGVEGAHCLENDLNNLDDFYKAGVRYIGPIHFFDNEWGGSAHGIKKAGLTEKGKMLIKKMNSMHITVDLAHASSKTIDDILAISTQPVLVSHTGVQGICNNSRNLSDKHLWQIGNRNGLVGIGLWETAVCGTDAVATAKSIRYVADKIGVDKVALGSDFDGAIDAAFDITGLPLLVNALIKEGFSRVDIEKIMGGNTRDFFLRNLPAGK